MHIRLTFCSVCGPQRTGRPFPGGLNSWRQKRDEVATLASQRRPRVLTPRETVNILGVSRKGPTNGRTGSKIRKELHDYLGGLCVQLGAEERDLAADIWTGVLCDRNDRVDDFAVRYGEVWSGSVPAVAAPGRPDDRGGHGHAEDGTSAE